ncbi:MAG: hypothetical protein ACUVYA_13090, partial [Planctomycetota bacterium]
PRRARPAHEDAAPANARAALERRKARRERRGEDVGRRRWGARMVEPRNGSGGFRTNGKARES